MVDLRLFLPETWTDDPGAWSELGSRGIDRSLVEPEIAIAEIARVVASRRAVRLRVPADAGYGSSRPFRQALSERAVCCGRWACRNARTLYPADVAADLPRRDNRKTPQVPHPRQAPVSAEAMSADDDMAKVSWRQGTKGRLSVLFAACRVQVADGRQAPDARQSHALHVGRGRSARWRAAVGRGAEIRCVEPAGRCDAQECSPPPPKQCWSWPGRL